MDQPGASATADFREFLRSGPDFDVLELSRAREPARPIDLEPVGSAAVEGVDEA
jgi:hypothetical protein